MSLPNTDFKTQEGLMHETYRGIIIYYDCPTRGKLASLIRIQAHFTYKDKPYTFRASSMMEVQLEAKQHIDLLLSEKIIEKEG